MIITARAAADLLQRRDNIVILAHRKPDGDTLGSCFALLFALESLGKTARVQCADGYPERYRILYGDYLPKAFEPAFVVACDVAGRDLLGALSDAYPKVDLCIDHHKSNELFAEQTVLDAAAPAAAMILYRVILAMGVRPDKAVASALYTGIATDTGCFRFANVCAAAHRVAAELIDCGADQRAINKLMFDDKSPGRIEVEKLVLGNLEFFHGGRGAIVGLPGDMYQRFGVGEDDLDGISAIPRRIRGVVCGVTIRENASGFHRVSMRCDLPLDASAICAEFGGGGHTGAAGCTVQGTVDEVRAKMREAVGEALAAKGL